MHKIACRIFTIDGWLLIALGIYAVLCNGTPTFLPIERIMDPGFLANGALSQGDLNFKAFAWDFLGMLHIVWGVNILFTVRHALLEKREAWAWKCMFASVAAWLLVDAYFTISVKGNSFVLATAFFAVLFIVPLVMTKKACGIRFLPRKHIAVH